MTNSCPFCAIVSGEAEASIVHTDETCLAFLTMRQVRPYETLVIPRDHFDHIADAPEEIATHLFKVANTIVRGLHHNLKHARVGVLIHGFGISHAHIIILPQHEHTDIVSGRHASVEDGQVIFNCDQIPESPRSDLDARAANIQSWIRS